MFSAHGKTPQEPNQEELDFVAGEGFNFVRIPTDYHFGQRISIILIRTKISSVILTGISKHATAAVFMPV